MSSFPIQINTLLSHSAALSYGFIELNSIIDQNCNVSGIDALGQSSMDLEERRDLLREQPLATSLVQVGAILLLRMFARDWLR